MKIRNKLTLLFTLIVAGVLLGLNLYIYIFYRSLVEKNFYELLEERATVSATVFLEADEQSSNIIQQYQKRYLRSLPKEVIRIYDWKNRRSFIEKEDTLTFSPNLIELVRQKHKYEGRMGLRQLVGLSYRDNEGDYVIIASAIDQRGISTLDDLLTVLLLGFILSIVAVFFAGRYFTKLTLRPVSEVAAEAANISETNLHLRLNEGNGKDELAMLSMTINKMLERLENAFELQKNFVANASHELRTPLTSIIGNIEVTLSKARTVEEHREVLETIQDEAEKLQRLTNGLLNLAQSNLNFVKLRKEPIRLDELIIECVNEIKVKRNSCNISFQVVHLPDNTDNLIIQGDKYLLETAFNNLIDNACKFSQGKQVNVMFESLKGDIHIGIQDAGIGIASNDLPHVTETFYRAANAIQFPGSGIGLTLSKRIIELHRGNILISSEEGNGTLVEIRFLLS